MDAIGDDPNIAAHRETRTTSAAGSVDRVSSIHAKQGRTRHCLHDWLLDRLETYFDFDGRMNDEGKPTAKLDIALTSVARLADVARQDPDFMQVGELYRDDPGLRRVSGSWPNWSRPRACRCCPCSATSPAGSASGPSGTDLELQRRRTRSTPGPGSRRPSEHLSEPAAGAKKKQVGTIPVPPKYTSADFLKSDYWRLRGKLDVPKERWVSFPHCEGPDGTLVIAWAGYDHLQLARAIERLLRGHPGTPRRP